MPFDTLDGRHERHVEGLPGYWRWSVLLIPRAEELSEGGDETRWNHSNGSGQLDLFRFSYA